MRVSQGQIRVFSQVGSEDSHCVSEHFHSLSEHSGGGSKDSDGTSEDSSKMSEHWDVVCELLKPVQLDSPTMRGHFDTN